MYMGSSGMTDFLMPISIMSLNSLKPRPMMSALSDAPQMPIRNDSTNAVVTVHSGLISNVNHGAMVAFSTALNGSVSVINDGKTAVPQA